MAGMFDTTLHPHGSGGKFVSTSGGGVTALAEDDILAAMKDILGEVKSPVEALRESNDPKGLLQDIAARIKASRAGQPVDVPASGTPAREFSGRVHVVSTHDPDTGKTKVHGVYADFDTAAKAHRDEVRKAYASHFEDDEGAASPRRIAHRTAVARLHDDNALVPSIHQAEVMDAGHGGVAPSEITLVHEGVRHPSGEAAAYPHAAYVDPSKGRAKAHDVSKRFYDNGHQATGNGEMSVADARKLAHDWNSEHPDHPVNRDADFENPATTPAALKSEFERRFGEIVDKPDAFPGLTKANAHQAGSDNLGRGESRSGVIKVTRHKVM